MDAVLRQVAPRGGDQFGGDDLPFQIFHALEQRRFGHGQHPAHFSEALLGVDQVGHRVNVGFALLNPVASGEAGVEHAVFDVARHFLRADQHAFDFRVVDRRENTSASWW